MRERVSLERLRVSVRFRAPHMRASMLRTIGSAIVVLCASASVALAQPRLSNGELRTTAVTGPLSRATVEALSKTGPAWAGYAVPAIGGDHQMCCWNGG